MKKRTLFIAIILLVFGATSVYALGSKPPAPKPSFNGNPLFERYVSLGDSLTHGFQSGAVDETRQPKAYPSLIAKKMGTEFNLPLLKFPGYLVNIEDVLKGNISWWQYYYPLVGGVRVDSYNNQSKINNFGITGSAAKDGLGTGGSAGGYYKLVLGANGAPEVVQGLDRNPTFVSFWLANNDILGAALSCDTGKLTPFNEFRNDFMACINRIASKMDYNGGSVKGVAVMNIPDVTCIAYLQDVTDPHFANGSLNPFWMLRPSANMMLTPADIAVIQQRTVQDNQVIENAALANGWAFVDTNAIFMTMNQYGHDLKDSTGVPAGRITITTDYLGGVFSLDGVHPSITGHSVAANYIIDEINATYGSNLSPIDEIATANSDSLLQHPVDPRNYLDGWVSDAIYFAVEIFM
ncbi:MAG: hypothetical protein GXP53_07915 [Deltaproteobacteria bacterium]|nr:hypothetical protein [Deltaproteobacteria bacterium]